MQPKSTALSLLNFLGVGSLFRNSVATSQARAEWRGPKYKRLGRNVGIHSMMKEEFEIQDARAFVCSPGCDRYGPYEVMGPVPAVGVRRKAWLGTLTIGSGRRGLQAKRVSGTRRQSVYRLTA